LAGRFLAIGAGHSGRQGRCIAAAKKMRTANERRASFLIGRSFMDCDRKVSGRLTAFTYGVLICALVGACDKSEQLRGALASQQLSWQQRMGALQSRATDLEQRLRALPPQPQGSGVEILAKRRRAEGAFIGTRQSLGDLQRNIEGTLREVEAAIDRDEVQGDQALADATARIGTYLQQQEENLAGAESALLHVGEAR
jgi:hypothetical protein